MACLQHCFDSSMLLVLQLEWHLICTKYTPVFLAHYDSMVSQTQKHSCCHKKILAVENTTQYTIIHTVQRHKKFLMHC